VAQLFVAEGMRVVAGAPLLRIVDRALDRRRIDAAGVVDALALAESAARSAGRTGEASRLEAERGEALALLETLDRRTAALTLRATDGGVVLTSHAEELVGRRVAAGDTLLSLASADSVEVRIALAGAGATRVRAGQVVHLVSFADPAAPLTTRVADVSSGGTGGRPGDGAVEARVRRSVADAWRSGAAGEASVELARSNVLGALWWNARQLVRVDLLL
jgi:multidrug resistance efflux pump